MGGCAGAQERPNENKADKTKKAQPISTPNDKLLKDNPTN